MQLAGTTAPPAPQYAEQANETGVMYGSNPMYAAIFKAIENGTDPITASNAAKAQFPEFSSMLPEDFNTQVVGVATQYAGNRAKAQNDRTQWETENADAVGGYTMPDGSKSKQAPLGGNDINSTASEYELLGAPSVDGLMRQYAESKNGISQRSGADQPVALGSWRVAKDGVPGGVAASEQFPMKKNSSLFTTDGSTTSNPRFKALEDRARQSVSNRVEQSKNVRIRSDANRNAMNRIMALAAVMQGDYPK